LRGWLRLLTAVEGPADRFPGPVDGFADRRFRAGDAVDGFFGGSGDAGFAKGATRRFVDAGYGFVDGPGGRARG
jgi:hypothetical protein